MNDFDDALNMTCRNCPVRKTGFCGETSVASLNELAGSLSTVILPSGSTILIQGNVINYFYIIRSGRVIVADTTMDGRHTMVGMIHEGGFFGGISGSDSRFSYEAATVVDLCMIPHTAFTRVAHKDPAFSYRAFELALIKLQTIQEWLALSHSATTTQRLAGYLYALSVETGTFLKKEEKQNLHMVVKRKDLAFYLGTTPETLSRSFHQLVNLGTLKTSNGKDVEIINIRKLKIMAGDTIDEMKLVCHFCRPAGE